MIPNVTPVILVKNDEYWLPYALEALRGRFDRYVIYDVNSQDATRDVINWFISTEKAEFFLRFLPETDPESQGAFRNSMIAEAGTKWYIIVDGDEVYPEASLKSLEEYVLSSNFTYMGLDVPYGVCQRLEFSTDLTQVYSEVRTHHRLYHRSAIFTGSHPGEDPVILQKPSREFTINGMFCHHFHNAKRSSLDEDVPSRIKRRSQHTYHPGHLTSYDLLKEVPILNRQIENFPMCPELKKLQDAIN